MKTFADLSRTRDNNFNLIRFVAAALVIGSHSFPLAGRRDPLETMTGTSIGELGVYIFFTLSGFLIAMSYASRHDLLVFLWARVLRIFPALIVCVALTVFLLGPALGSLTTGQYFAHPLTYKYLLNNTLLISRHFQAELPGVFSENPFPDSVNGSLWTLPIEMRMYLLIALVGCAGLLRRKGLLSLMILVLFPLIAPAITIDPRTLRLAGLFLIGALLFFNQDKVPSSVLVLAGLALLAVTLQKSRFFEIAAIIFLAYAVFWLGLVPGGWIRRFNALGDYSYGLYIYGFPVQQAVVALQPGIRPGPLFAISLPLTLGLAVASWHLIEKPALALKELKPFHLRQVIAQFFKNRGKTSRSGPEEIALIK